MRSCLLRMNEWMTVMLKQMSKINYVVRMEGQISKDCVVTKSGSTEDQNSVRKVNSDIQKKVKKKFKN